MSWTIDGVAVVWRRDEESGVPVEPTWHAEPRERIRTFLGSKHANITIVGYEATTLEGAIAVASASDAATLRAKHGAVVTVACDSGAGAGTWTAYMKIRLREWTRGDGWYVGTVALTRMTGD